jgi:hypothetical protein
VLPFAPRPLIHSYDPDLIGGTAGFGEPGATLWQGCISSPASGSAAHRLPHPSLPRSRARGLAPSTSVEHEVRKGFFKGSTLTERIGTAESSHSQQQTNWPSTGRQGLWGNADTCCESGRRLDGSQDKGA